jgi:hypothetical protein
MIFVLRLQTQADMKQRPSILMEEILPGMWEDLERDAVCQRFFSHNGFFVKLDRPKVIETFERLKKENNPPDPKWIEMTGSQPNLYNTIRSPEFEAYFFLGDKSAQLRSTLTGRTITSLNFESAPVVYTKETKMPNTHIGDFIDTLVGHLLYRDSYHLDPTQIHLIFFF